MNFDPKLYTEEYLRPRRRVTHLSDDDLLERYAITLPASLTDIEQQIRAVRSVWNAQGAGSALAKISHLCRTADEQLRKQHGNAITTPQWWQEQAAKGQEASQARSRR